MRKLALTAAALIASTSTAAIAEEWVIYSQDQPAPGWEFSYDPSSIRQAQDAYRRINVKWKIPPSALGKGHHEALMETTKGSEVDYVTTIMEFDCSRERFRGIEQFVHAKNGDKFPLDQFEESWEYIESNEFISGAAKHACSDTAFAQRFISDQTLEEETTGAYSLALALDKHCFSQDVSTSSEEASFNATMTRFFESLRKLREVDQSEWNEAMNTAWIKVQKSDWENQRTSQTIATSASLAFSLRGRKGHTSFCRYQIESFELDYELAAIQYERKRQLANASIQEELVLKERPF
jgi:hypothetical protein